VRQDDFAHGLNGETFHALTEVSPFRVAHADGQWIGDVIAAGQMVDGDVQVLAESFDHAIDF
jgi:hypothetical protein